MRYTRILMMAALSACFPAAYGQSTDADTPLVSSKMGFHLDEVSVFGGYFSGGRPFGGNLPITGGSFYPTALDKTDIFGASTAVAWTKGNEQSSLAIQYSPSITGSTRVHSLNSLNHRFLVDWTRSWHKWSFNVTAGGATTLVQQQLFNPTVGSALAGSGATFDGLASTVLGGNSPPELGVLQADAGLSLPPEIASYYGRRVLTTHLSTSLSWAASSRTSLSFSASGGRTQHLNDSTLAGETAAPNPYLVYDSTQAILAVSLAHSVTPRTELTVSAGTTRIFSTLQEGYLSNATMGIGRKMSERWFVRGVVGVGTVTYLRDSTAPPRRVQQVLGGSIGFKTRAHTFTAAYNRAVGDSYGLGSAATHGATGSWHWRSPGSGWNFSADSGYEELSNPALHNLKTWRANGSVSRALGSHFAITAHFGYYSLPTHLFTGDSSSAADRLTQEGAMLSLAWFPRWRR